MTEQQVKYEDCLFCKIAKDKAPVHKFWEDDKHLAFLSIFPNTEGFSVVITKEHYPSYVFSLPDEVLTGLFKATKQVANLLDAKFEDVGRTGMILEGFGVNHAHIKLFPMHGTNIPEWQPIAPKLDKYFAKYEGYISSHDCKRADDEKLAELARKLRG
ncbi:MAG: HIT family protein [bacterium]|nr:HIT family protein [bacterium]